MRQLWSQRPTAGKPRMGGLLPACLGGTVGVVLALMVYAPASWLAAGVAAVTAGRVQLLQAQGTLWNGSAAVVLTAAAGGSSAMTWPSRWEWRIRPKGLGLDVQLQSACCTPVPLRFRMDAAGVQAQAAVLHVPMALLQGLGTPWNTLQLQGELQLNWNTWQVTRQGGWQGELQLRAMHVSTRLSTLPEIGSYQMAVQGGAQPRMQVTTLQGPLQIEGNGQLQQGRWRFQGKAQAQPEQAQALANLLNLLGQRSGDTTRIQWG